MIFQSSGLQINESNLLQTRDIWPKLVLSSHENILMHSSSGSLLNVLSLLFRLRVCDNGRELLLLLLLLLVTADIDGEFKV